MALIPFFAFMTALFSILLYYAGLESVSIGFFIITTLLAIIGLILGVKERPASSRIACAVSILLASTPLIAPVVEEFRLAQLEAAKRKENAPKFAALEETVEAIEPKIIEYYRTHNVMPEYQGAETLPYVDDQGRLRTRPSMDELEAPDDPFLPSQPLRWVALRGTGVLLVSVSHDGEAQMPLPGISIDGPPMDPLVPFAALGVDPREVRFTEEGNALIIGDIVRWIGKGTYEEAFSRLFDAWDVANSTSPYLPSASRKESEVTQSTKDAIGANKLIEEGNYFGALALASRGINERNQYPAQWSSEDSSLDYLKGLALYHLGAYRQSADSLVVYIGNNPNDAMGHFYLSAALYYGGNERDAELHMAAAQQVDPNSPIVRQADKIMEQLKTNSSPEYPRPNVLSRNNGSNR